MRSITRRLRGISVDELARLTRIPLRSLERLEAGAFDGTPDGFVRGFVRTVAEALGLDPDDAVNRLLREPREDEALLAARAREQRKRLALRLALAATALLMLLALGRLTVWLFAGGGEDEAPVVYRRDALRELSGRKVLVHCAMNMRVSCFMSLYGEAELGWSRAQAEAHVRRVWEPDAIWAGFLSRLRSVLSRSSSRF